MKIVKSLLAATALVASIGASASAQVNGAALASAPALFPFQPLNGAGACGVCSLGPAGSIAKINGGSILSTDLISADNGAFASSGGIQQMPANFLAAGQGVGQPSIVSFNVFVNYVSFLWGSPDLYNRLTVTTNTGAAQVFVAGADIAGATGLNLGNQSGSQAFSQYVSFQSVLPGTAITSLIFSNDPVNRDAFEATNFSVGTTRVPEPSNIALVAAGLAALAMVSRRRKLLS